LVSKHTKGDNQSHLKEAFGMHKKTTKRAATIITGVKRVKPLQTKVNLVPDIDSDSGSFQSSMSPEAKKPSYDEHATTPSTGSSDLMKPIDNIGEI
jgi:hypothetical protein